MVTCQCARDYDVSHTSPRQAGTWHGLATPSSEAYETGSEREDRNRADCCRRETSGDSTELSQGCLTKCPCCTANYKSVNAMRTWRPQDGEECEAGRDSS